MSHTTDSMTFEIFVGISFSSLLLFPGHGDIQHWFSLVELFNDENHIIEIDYA